MPVSFLFVLSHPKKIIQKTMKKLILLTLMTVSLAGTSLAQRKSLINSIPYHNINIQLMYDLMRNNPVGSAEMFFRNDHNYISMDIDVYPYFFLKHTSFNSKIGYTYFFLPEIGGFGLHADWKNAFIPTNKQNNNNGQYVLINHYLFGPEYMLYINQEIALDFRVMGGINFDYEKKGSPMFSFQFEWDFPNIFTVEGLSFLGNFEFLYGPEYTFNNIDESGNTIKNSSKTSFHGEATVLYNLARVFGRKSRNLWQEREKFGVFVKLLFTKSYPLGWNRAADYYKNQDLTLTPCLGLRWDF